MFLSSKHPKIAIGHNRIQNVRHIAEKSIAHVSIKLVSCGPLA